MIPTRPFRLFYDSRVLCAGLGTAVQKGCETAGECPEKGYKDGEGPTGGDVRGVAVVTWPLQPILRNHQ